MIIQLLISILESEKLTVSRKKVTNKLRQKDHTLDSEWKWQYRTDTETIENCDQNRFGSKPQSFWAVDEPQQESSHKFGRLTVNKYPDINNWSAGTGNGGTHVGYVCGPLLNQGRIDHETNLFFNY